MQPTACVINLTDAKHSVELLKINGHLATAHTGDCVLASRRKTVGGHDWVIAYHPNVYNHRDFEIWIQLSITLDSDATVVLASFACSVVDQTGARPPSPAVSTSGKLSKGNVINLLVMSRPQLVSSGYIKDDSIILKCGITVLHLDKDKPKDATTTAMAAPGTSSDLPKHFGELWQSKKGTDITFLVAGEPIAAHRCVLAARSPVFMAELFGDMKETASQSVVIEDMEPDVFRALVQFMYTDTSPPELDTQEEKDEDANATAKAMAQHLLAAADRYGMERLKLICEDKMCGDVIVGTVAAHLVLAEQHECPKLKARCMEFMVATPANLQAVVATEGYKHLMESYPSALSDLLMSVVQRQSN